MPNNSDVSKTRGFNGWDFNLPTVLNGFSRRISVINRMINWSYLAATSAQDFSFRLSKQQGPSLRFHIFNTKKCEKKNGSKFHLESIFKKIFHILPKILSMVQKSGDHHSTLVVEIPISYRVLYIQTVLWPWELWTKQQYLWLPLHDLPHLPTWILSLHHLALSA